MQDSYENYESSKHFSSIFFKKHNIFLIFKFPHLTVIMTSDVNALLIVKYEKKNHDKLNDQSYIRRLFK